MQHAGSSVCGNKSEKQCRQIPGKSPVEPNELPPFYARRRPSKCQITQRLKMGYYLPNLKPDTLGKLEGKLGRKTLGKPLENFDTDRTQNNS
jgi:hypothetical protein